MRGSKMTYAGASLVCRPRSSFAYTRRPPCLAWASCVVRDLRDTTLALIIEVGRYGMRDSASRMRKRLLMVTAIILVLGGIGLWMRHALSPDELKELLVRRISSAIGGE